ncbi:MAG TPA: LamG domain-containing protein, partial [Humisphaera sp.]|nr:LamG domain-containing protein [Humisphaera sp.]
MSLLLLSVTSPSASAQTVDGGKFGRALKVVEGAYAAAPYSQVYFSMPMTVECWAKLPAKPTADAIVLSSGPRHSNEHWEIYAAANSGDLCASFGGYNPRQIKSAAPIADEQWHFIAMTFDGTNVGIYADGKEVARAAVKKVGPYPDTGSLTFGLVEGGHATVGAMIDEVRISRVLRPTDHVPTAAFTVDADTVGLWHFDEDTVAYDKTGFADSSTMHAPARLELITQDALTTTGGFDGTRGAHTRWADMDYGVFFTSSLGIPKDKSSTTPKAISIRLGKDKKHAIAFDTDLLRYSFGWSGDFIKIYNGREGLAQHPDIAGDVKFRTEALPGWGKPIGNDADFYGLPLGNDFFDPRPDKLGPLPADWAKYKGLYVHGDRVVLSYTVGGTQVLEMPGVEEFGKKAAFTRTLFIAPSKKRTCLRVCDVAKHSGDVVFRGKVWAVTDGKDNITTAAAVIGGTSEKNDDVKLLNGRQGRGFNGNAESLLLVLEAHEKPLRFKVVVWSGPAADSNAFDAFIEKSVGPVEDIQPLTQGGPARFPDPVVTKGVVGKPDPKSDGAYVVDTLTAPDENPWKSFLRFGGVDFFKNGDAALCSISGDVWVVSGIDDKLENLKWRRYATGLFQPLGLKIVDDTVYVLGRDQITRLHDLNGDGEADFYESFNNECKVTPNNGHAYTTCLETDAEGNFYYCKCGDSTSDGGSVLRCDKYGNNLEVFAPGIRNPNGLGGGPNGLITEADNEGEWVPASRIDIVKKGRFLGFTPMAHSDKPPTDPGKPIVWMPQDVDNSSGGQTWVLGNKWGLPDGEMLHTSYGMAALLHVMTEEVDGITQGGVYRFPFRFATGVMRARFRPTDGQLYLTGLRGWQTAGVKDGALQRVRYTGKPLHQPASLHIHANGILLSFTCPLDPKTAADAESFSILQWNYKWAAVYGSRFYSIREAPRQGYDTLTVKSATLL